MNFRDTPITDSQRDSIHVEGNSNLVGDAPRPGLAGGWINLRLQVTASLTGEGHGGGVQWRFGDFTHFAVKGQISRGVELEINIHTLLHQVPITLVEH